MTKKTRRERRQAYNSSNRNDNYHDQRGNTGMTTNTQSDDTHKPTRNIVLRRSRYEEALAIRKEAQNMGSRRFIQSSNEVTHAL